MSVVNTKPQFALSQGVLSKRHRVRNNLPGTRAFCPLVRRTPALDELARISLSDKVKAAIGAVHPDVLARAAAFLWLSESRASFHIKGEKPAPDRAHRWAQAIGSAGATALLPDHIDARHEDLRSLIKPRAPSAAAPCAVGRRLRTGRRHFSRQRGDAA